MSTSGLILVTCATGQLGQLVLNACLNNNIPAKDIIGCCRNPLKPQAVALAKKGVNFRQADYSKPDTLATAMAGIQTLLFISSGTLEKRVEQHQNVVNAAKDAGVKHIIYTGFIKCPTLSLTRDHTATEEAIQKTGIPYTIFRNSLYMDLIPTFLEDSLKTGKFNFPAGTAKCNFVCKEDVAEALAKVMYDSKPHVNKIYDIVADRPHSFQEIAEIGTKLSGKPCEYKSITIEEYKVHLKSLGMSEALITLTVNIAETIASGQLDIVNNNLETVLKRKPKTLQQVAPSLLKL